MKKMRQVMTIRLADEDVRLVEELAKSSDKDKSTMVRDLVEYGKIYLAIKLYKEGKISIGKAAQIANLSISETMDLFAELGIKSNIELEDYLEGLKYAREII